MNHPSPLLTRRSVKAALLDEPAPDANQLQHILTVATRVPDHGKLAPWRIKVLHAAGQEKLADVVATRFAERNADATPQQIEHERKQIMRAPLLLVVMVVPQFGRIPEWEQHLSTGAVCMNIMHACHELGFGANWLTEWVAYDDTIKTALGGGADNKIAGFIYIGSYDEKPEDRPRPALIDVVSEWVG